MTYRIKGTLKLPSGQPADSVDIEFISRRNYSPLLMDLSSVIKTTPTGGYDITLEYGEYAVVVYWGCNQPSHVGKLFVYSDTATGLDLQTLLQQSDWQPATPEYIQQIQDWLDQSRSSAAQAANSAVRAENAALTITGAIIDGGQCDLSSGFYPQPFTIESKKYSTVWYVKVGGTVGGITYDSGDKLQYTTASGGFYFRIDARDDVVSVNGKKGAVTLNAKEIGAAPAGFGIGEEPRPALAQEQTLGGLFRDSSISYGAVCIPYDKTPTQLFVGVSITGGIKLKFGVRTGSTSEPIRFFDALSTGTTTIDSNGFIKQASPIARLYGSEALAMRDSEYSASGCAAVNDEADGVRAVRDGVGVYRITGCLGFATDGWYIETPSDANGNKLLFVEYEQSESGDILVKTFSPDYSSGRCMAGEPKDIPAGRWIDLRLSMPTKE